MQFFNVTAWLRFLSFHERFLLMNQGGYGCGGGGCGGGGYGGNSYNGGCGGYDAYQHESTWTAVCGRLFLTKIMEHDPLFAMPNP